MTRIWAPKLPAQNADSRTKLLHPRQRRIGTPMQELGEQWCAYFEREAIKKQQADRANWRNNTEAWHTFPSFWTGIQAVRVVLTRSTEHTTEWKVARIALDSGEHEISGWERK